MAQKKKAEKKSTEKKGKGKRKDGRKKTSAGKGGARASARAGGKAKAPKGKAAAKAKGPQRVSTGKGPGPLEVANRLVELMRAGKAGDAERDLLAADIESVEGLGVSQAWKGRKAVLEKYRSWEADHDIHEMNVEGPWVGATGFAVKYRIDVTQKSTGQRQQMEEIAVYTLRDGKITREEFHFATGA